MGPCILSIFQYISNKMQCYAVYLYLETALWVSGGNSTHHQERIQLYVQYLAFVTPLLLSAAIVEKLELVSVCCGWRTPPTAHSNRFQLASYWIYNGILLGAHYILHISRIRVNARDQFSHSYKETHNTRVLNFLIRLLLESKQEDKKKF